MNRILLKNIDLLATFDNNRSVVKHAWMIIQDNRIEALGVGDYAGEALPQQYDLSGYVVLPGLVNLHHHFYQALLKNVPTLQDVSLFRWLRDMYYLMSEVTDEDLDIASRLNIAELLLSGCTTTVDHSYLQVNDMKHDTEIAAAREMGIRFHLARGSHSVEPGENTILPHLLSDNVDDVLADTERLIKTYHDSREGAMVRIVNAPSSLLAVTDRLWIESIDLARKHGIQNHAHMAEAPDEERYVLKKYGKRSVEKAEELGWVGPDVWYAHATMLNDAEKAIIQRTGTGICNCPNSNMYTSAGVCKVAPMLRQGGFKIGIGVDGSAANNSSNLLREARSALLIQRAFFGADAMSPTQVLELAILGGAQVLQRDDIGVLAPGKMADLIGFDTRKLALSGGIHDPIAGLVLCDVNRVDLSIINGVPRVVQGELIGVNVSGLIHKANEHATALVKRAERRNQISLSHSVWRRAYPYDELES